MSISQNTETPDLGSIRRRADEAKAAVDQTRFAGPADLVAHGLKAAASAADVPALIAEVERLRALLEPAHDPSQPTPPFPLAEGDKVTVTVDATVYDVPGWDVAEDPDPSGDRWTFAFEVAGERQLLSLTQDEVIARVRKP